MADELVAEFTNGEDLLVSPDQVHLMESTGKPVVPFLSLINFIDFFFSQQQYDEKNIRRRVYDALNVLMAMDIISKEKKEIQWRGLPSTEIDDIEPLKVKVWTFVYGSSMA